MLNVFIHARNVRTKYTQDMPALNCFLSRRAQLVDVENENDGKNQEGFQNI